MGYGCHTLKADGQAVALCNGTIPWVSVALGFIITSLLRRTAFAQHQLRGGGYMLAR